MAPAAVGAEIVASGQLDFVGDRLALYCFELGKLFPDAGLLIESVAPVAVPAPAPVADPWALSREGRYEEAEKILAGTQLDSAGRDKLRQMLTGSDAKAAIFACHVAASTQWKSVAVNLRTLLSWPDADVKIAAMEAIGVLAGPAMAPSVRPLMSDKDERVRTAAAETMKRLGW